MAGINTLMTNRGLAAAALAAAIIIAALLVFGIQWNHPNLKYNGYIGNITVAKAIPLSAMLANSPNVVVDTLANRITFKSSNASVVVLNIDVSEAVAIANLNKTKYLSQHDVLVIGGLVYPTIILPDNSTLNITFVNLDQDENCGIFVNYANPALQAAATPTSLYASSTFKTPLIEGFNAPQGVAQAAFAPGTRFGNFTTLWYLNSCAANVTYGTLHNGAFYG